MRKSFLEQRDLFTYRYIHYRSFYYYICNNLLLVLTKEYCLRIIHLLKCKNLVHLPCTIPDCNNNLKLVVDFKSLYRFPNFRK